MLELKEFFTLRYKAEVLKGLHRFYQNKPMFKRAKKHYEYIQNVFTVLNDTQDQQQRYSELGKAVS